MRLTNLSIVTFRH